MRIVFGYAAELDPSEYRMGFAPTARDCYRLQIGQEEHWQKRPGLSSFATGLAGVVRGFYKTTTGKVLALAGSTVYELSSSGTATAYTGTASGSNPGVWAETLDGYIYLAHGDTIKKIDTSAQTVSALTGSPKGVSHVVHAKGYLLANGSISGGITGDTNYSDSSGYTAWEAFNNEQFPDGLSALAAGWDGEVYAFGTRSVEVSYNDGSTPWALLQGATMAYGCLAPHSLAFANNTFYWLTEADGARRVVQMANRTPVVVSTPFDRLLNETFSTVTDAIGWVQTIRGRTFYLISFPTEDVTLALQLAEGGWSEFNYWDGPDYERYLGRCALWVDAWGKTLVGSRLGGTIYEQTGTTDAGGTIRMELTSGATDHGTNHRKRENQLIHRVKRGYGAGGSFGFRVRDDNKQWQDEKTYSLGDLGSTNPYLRRPSGGVFRSRQYQYIHADEETDFIVMGLDSETVRAR